MTTQEQYQPRYWNNKGRFQKECEELSKELMPVAGPAETYEGEVIRAANRLYYDAFNNGFCNNTSGALNFLYEWARYNAFIGLSSKFQPIYDVLKDRVNTGGYSLVTEEVARALDDMVDLVIEWVLTEGEAARTRNKFDLFDFQDDDVYEDEDEDDEYYYCEEEEDYIR